MRANASDLEVGRRIAVAAAAVLLHALFLLTALLVYLPAPLSDSGPIELRFTAPARQLPVTSPSRGVPVKPDDRDESRPPPPAALPAAAPNTNTASETLEIDASAPNSMRSAPTTALRSVLDRGLTPEQAWDILGRLLDEYPQYRDSVLREMIAGSGLPADSLPRVNLSLDQMLKNGIKPTWETQRTAIEDAFKSYDAVMGWTNKGGYGPSINIIGVIKFLIDLIEGKK